MAITVGYDIIGDIHGEQAKLVALLEKLGYKRSDGVWRHSTRQVIFVGDFIDRGPEQLRTVDLVRAMVDSGSALAVMGNHEFNAIAWFTRKPGSDDYLRTRVGSKGEDNRAQHRKFLDEVEGSPKHAEIIDWFKTLPLWLDLPGLRVIHACWHQPSIDYMRPKLESGGRLNFELMIEATREPPEAEKDSLEPSVFKAVEILLKGLEIPLPDGVSFRDKDGRLRKRTRVRWWDDAATTYRKAAMLSGAKVELPDVPIPVHATIKYESEKPVFFGHYWFAGHETPAPANLRLACLDYSAAKGGPLVAYRWHGESILNAASFVSATA